MIDSNKLNSKKLTWVNIQGKTDLAVAAMDDGSHEVKKGTEVMEQAGKVFKDIAGQVKEIASIAQGASKGMDELSTSGQTVLAAVQEVEKISREISDHIQTVSAATEEQSASMEEVASSSQTIQYGGRTTDGCKEIYKRIWKVRLLEFVSTVSDKNEDLIFWLLLST